MLQLMKKQTDGSWADVAGKQVPVVLDKDKPYLDTVKVAVATSTAPATAASTAASTAPAMPAEVQLAQGRSISIVYAGSNSDQIIPVYIASAMPKWFGLLFLLTLLAAAMSTLSSQLHASGTSLAHDVYGTLSGRKGSIGLMRLAILVGLVLATWVGLQARGGMIIARATSIFMGLCASAFLPALFGGLYWRRMTRAAALASMAVGFVVTAFWLAFIKAAEAQAIGLVTYFVPAGKFSILWNYPNWPVVDPIVIALPLSAIVAIVVSLVTQPPGQEHLDRCFGTGK
jgi:SSS family solute:Na+ symporter